MLMQQVGAWPALSDLKLARLHSILQNQRTHARPLSTQAQLREADYQKHLHALLGGRREVRNPAGRIDILSPDFGIIEVKTASCYKHSLGQLVCYSAYLPGHCLCMALIGLPNRECMHICDSMQIVLLYYHAGRWQLPSHLSTLARKASAENSTSIVD